MSARFLVTLLLAGWLVFGDYRLVNGQVELDGRLEDVFVDTEEFDDRFGGYVPVTLESDGPQLLAQIEELPATVTPPLRAPASPAWTPPPATTGPTYVAPAAPPVIYYESMPMYAAPSPGYHCPPWRPCGPSESYGGNWLFHQTFAGADFRPACARHDACLMNGCTSRRCCDKQFLWELKQSCDNSAFPILCRMEARKYYLGVRLFGWLF